MAFRLGHQISCKIHKHLIIRSSSADSSHRFKSLSPIAFNRRLCGNSGFKQNHAALPRTRSMPAPEDTLNLSSRRRLSSDKNVDPESEDVVYVNESKTKEETAPHNKSTSLNLEPKTPFSGLQPSNLAPIPTSYIHHTSGNLSKSSRPRTLAVESLRRLASIKYEKAVKALNLHAEEETYRYQLDAAKPRVGKGSKIFNVHQLYKKKYQTATAKVPQLQPKNIKPYGNINTMPWCAPNVEYYKQGIMAEKNKKGRNSKTGTKSKRSGAENDTSKGPHTQQREYCTVKLDVQPVSPQSSPEIEKCRNIISDYKKINPDFTEKKKKLTPGSEEEKRFIEQAEKFVADVKGIQQKHNLDLESKQNLQRTKNDIMAGIQAEKRQLQDMLNFTPTYKPKVNLPQSSKGKVVLYYEQKHGNKVLCSKIIKEQVNSENAEDSVKSINSLECKGDPIKITVGPKLMLQSMNLKDNIDQIQQLTPSTNEKFISPWLSWGDRVKLMIEKKKNKISTTPGDKTMSTNTQELTLKKSNNLLTSDTINDVRCTSNQQSDMQKRTFSNLTTIESLLNGTKDPFSIDGEVDKINWTDLWNKTNGGLRADEIWLKKNLDGKSSLNPTISNRFFSTNSTRGVLGPEGTVMVKLRRLPKVDIPEPPKVCETTTDQECFRSDGVITVKEKKLPKLVPTECPPPTQSRMKDTAPLVRPKSRGEPKPPPRVCPTDKDDCPERADRNLKIVPKKLPKIEPRDCFPCVETKMTSRSLPRLKPRPVPPPPPCKEIVNDLCSPRADEGLKVVRKKLPPLKMSDCCPVCESGMKEGEPLKRLKKTPIPEPKQICYEEEDPCPPRADDVVGYKSERKKLQTIILSEKNNNLSWKEFNLQNSGSKKNYTTDSKCSMCCYSDKKVHPDIKSIEEQSFSKWDKFEGCLLPGPDGKLKAYVPPEEQIDNSLGTELKVLRKAAGSSFRKENHLHEDLLKSGFTTFMNHDRKYSLHMLQRSFHKDCIDPPKQSPLKDFNLRRVQKRKDFDKDFPPTVHRQKVVKSICSEPRMDEILNYEVKRKSLPPLPKGKCIRIEQEKPKGALKALKRLKKRMEYSDYECPKECEDVCPPRADDDLVEVPKKLPVLVLTNCPKPERRYAPDEKDAVTPLKPRFVYADEPRCLPKHIDAQKAQRADANKDLYKRKSLPVLEPKNCPCVPITKPTSKLKLVRYTKKVQQDRAESCKPPESICADRADTITNYQVKKKKLKVLLKSDNKSYCTLPNNLAYYENFSRFDSKRYISLSNHLLVSTKKECKKLSKQGGKKCYKLQIEKCKQAESISCKRKPRHSTCTKQRSPYPSFSECKEHDENDHLTECRETNRHLQPRWPILGVIRTQKPPPPHQGKIDPLKEEECITRKLSLQLEGETKTCESFDRPSKPVMMKEMYQDVMKNLPYDECECANEAKPPPKFEDKGPCKPIDRSVCKDPEIECTMEMPSRASMGCMKDEDSEKTKSVSKPKLTCKKKSSKTSASEAQNDPCKDECKTSDPCEEIKKDKCQEAKPDPCKQTDDCKEIKSDPCQKSTEDKCKEMKKEEDKKAKSECKKVQSECKERKPPVQRKVEKKCEQPKPKPCKPPDQNQCAKMKRECEEQKKTNDKATTKRNEKCDEPEPTSCKSAEQKKCSPKKQKSQCGSKKSHCRNVKSCKKLGKKKGKPKKCSDLLKEDSQKAKSSKPKKCSDLLKEDYKKTKPKKPKKCSDLLKDDKKQKTPGTSKSKTTKQTPEKKTAPYPAVPPKCPPKGIIARIIDFFRAKPGCPAPDQWKKDKLRKKAEQAAAAAGYELCEKKPPKLVKVVCKKTGVRDHKAPSRSAAKSKDKKPGKKVCKSECVPAKATKHENKPTIQECKPVKICKPVKQQECKPAKQEECKPVKQECKPAKQECKEECHPEGKEETNLCKVADVVKAKECPEASEDCVEDKEAGPSVSPSGKKCKLPRQKYCKPPARTSCNTKNVDVPCTTVESPYPSFSECGRQFPKLPITECSEQEKNVKRKTITTDYDDPNKTKTREYSTYTLQRRHYSSSTNGGRNNDPFSLFSITQDSLKDTKNDELALKILTVVKEGMKAMTALNQNNAQEMYYSIFKELEILCEQELNKKMKNEIPLDARKNIRIKRDDVLSDFNVNYETEKRNQPSIDLEQKAMADAIKNFCKMIFTVPDLSTKNYEESERLKTEKLQKQLDEILDNYKQR